jgi:hypothetical protein
MRSVDAPQVGFFSTELAVNYPADHFQTASSECVDTQPAAGKHVSSLSPLDDLLP